MEATTYFTLSERRKRERQEETASRRREWNERFGGREEEEMSESAGQAAIRSKQPTSEYGSTLHAPKPTPRPDSKHASKDVYTVTDGISIHYYFKCVH